ncbi:TonB-dependent receptor plug domain-containing protein [Winogradskyella endarachnes]|uniref:TonB-dependent receptor plug domain-containing protein n=1 Tax=Winogradskyella endarachnes TaxID=2681965 RepID=A0A6L6U885_9FLAO|nr:TonB-dependent receptor plug domain-containing protein [Winogradskyella endarachnes]MUU77092.1 TonB-dependent receptor plug domain-containing protein [Winogradskyella endarachnes]
MNLRVFSYKLIITIACCCAINLGTCQTTRGIKLSDKLEELEKKFDVNFSYNHTFFDGIFLKYDFNCETIEACLSIIQQRIPVSFDTKDTINFMVIPERSTISFNVIEEESNETVSELIYQINQSKRLNIKAQNGVFTLKDVFPLDSIHIYSGFHKDIHIQAKDLKSAKTLKFYKEQFHLDGVILKSYLTEGIDAKISNHILQIDTETLGLLAGETDGDIFNVLNSIPGIHSPSGKSGNLNFRGSTYDQNLIQIDDIPIYHSGHFLGAISPYNSSVITNVDVQRNTLPAKYGGRVGGLIDMVTTNKILDSTRYEVAVNTLFSGATIKTKLIEDKLSLIAGFRGSYPRFKSPKLEAISELIFQGSKLESEADQVNTSDDFEMGFSDMNAKLNYKINDKHSASISFINIQNDLSAEIKGDSGSNETDFRDLELDNWGITGKWTANFSEKWTSELRLSRSKMYLVSDSQGFVLEERNSRQKYDNTITDSRLITEVVYNYSKSLLFETGYTLTEHSLVSNEVDQENSIDSKRNQSATVHSSYLSLQKNWQDILIINFGFHNNYYSPTKQLYINPRFTASFAVNKRLYLKSSFGSSNQFIQKKYTNDFDDFNITNQLWYLPSKDISTLKAKQGMLGVVYDNSKWLIDLELYSKKTNHITNKSDNAQGSLISSGANLFVKKRWNNIETWVSYALSSTESDFSGVTTDAFFDQTHLLNITTLFNLKQWKFALSWGYFSGMPVIFPDETDSNTLDPILSDRFDAQHQLDFSSSYTFYNSLRTLKTVIGLSILNVYNADNTVNIFQNTSESTYRKGTKFSPNLQVNFYF